MKKNALFTLLLSFVLMASTNGQSVVNTLHDLSVTGPGTDFKAVSEPEVCIFCHTPHASRPVSPLWNRNDPGSTYTLYSSSTLQALPGQPDGSAVMCLSCHDGTIALGELVSRTTDVTFSSGLTIMPPGKNNLATDLSDDHPVSFTYTPALASSDGQLKDPSAIGIPVTLENGKVQCISCHDPHNNTNAKFLVASKQYSDLCFKCHNRNYWASSTHGSSGAVWNGAGVNPWAHIETPYATVTENACENCHDPHTATGKPRLLKGITDEDNCIDCHNGNVANTNIQSEVLKVYSHGVFNYDGLHDASEAALSTTLHVECQDCHNPHAVNGTSAVAPNANGFLAGVQGIDQNGNLVNPINFAYELCYRCHADSPSKPSSPTSRLIEQDNVRLEFDLSSPSHHAVEGAGANPNVPSLYNGYTTSSILYCTDCHASDDVSSPAGPHGSMYNQILRSQYITTDPNPYNVSSYQLCFNCHDPVSILNDDSFGDHDKHIRGEDTSCNVCHDPHGVSSTQGNSTNNSHLINFDLSVVTSVMGKIEFVDQGTFKGECTLRCHGKSHKGKGY